jgi:hypothetical protein
MLCEPKKCTLCKRIQPQSNFYVCGGITRSDCKDCRKRKNADYQRENESWKFRISDEAKKAYSRAYYQDNKDKFAKYRADFKEKHPEYYKNYTAK